jgi:hypothetical protein
MYLSVVRGWGDGDGNSYKGVDLYGGLCGSVESGGRQVR